MTVNKAVAKAVNILGDTFSREVLIGWLSEIESTATLEISATHENDSADKRVISPEENGERELFVPDPFSRLYVEYLLMKADATLGDSGRYMNSASQFAASYQSFADHYNRENMPLQRGKVTL